MNRLLLFSPGNDAEAKELANLVGYCLAYTAERYGIRIHAAVWMSNHHHIDIFDPEGNIVGFKQQLHSLLARARNAYLGRGGALWTPEKPCDTREPTDEESLAGLVYTLTNPVDAGLVRSSSLWPGFTTAGWRFGETRSFHRPTWFFDEDGDMPETASLTLARPPIFPDLDDDTLYERLVMEVRAREFEIQQKFRRESRRFMGPRKLAKQRWNRAPQSFEERFGITPKYAASSKWLILAELQRDREWERQYAAARALLREGKPAVFPAGTYWLRHFAGVTVADPDRPP